MKNGARLQDSRLSIHHAQMSLIVFHKHFVKQHIQQITTHFTHVFMFQFFASQKWGIYCTFEFLFFWWLFSTQVRRDGTHSPFSPRFVYACLISRQFHVQDCSVFPVLLFNLNVISFEFGNRDEMEISRSMRSSACQWVIFENSSYSMRKAIGVKLMLDGTSKHKCGTSPHPLYSRPLPHFWLSCNFEANIFLSIIMLHYYWDLRSHLLHTTGRRVSSSQWCIWSCHFGGVAAKIPPILWRSFQNVDDDLLESRISYKHAVFWKYWFRN
jgi:hypothetical protein